jgi:hypothetical protein
MLHPHEYICPACGLILDSMAAYRRQWAKKHEREAPEVNYQNGCPILDGED